MMRSLIVFILLLGFIAVAILFVMSLINPKQLNLNKEILKTYSRKRLAIYYPAGMFILLILIVLVAPASTSTSQQNSTTKDGKGSQQKDSDATKREPATEKKAQLSELYQVVKVVDGDTIDVSINGETQRLRLIGIDTPETLDPRKPVQCFGKEASNKAKELLEGKKVRLESDDTQDNRDKYNRLLRYVYLEDGTMYNKTIIAEGYAHEYTYQIPYKYQKEFKQAQSDAEKAQKGLWSPSTCSGDTEKSAVQVAPTPPPVPTTAPSPAPTSSSNCDPNYSPCIPNVSYDLDCGDISTSVRVIGTDRHRFDRDGDGTGCESN